MIRKKKTIYVNLNKKEKKDLFLDDKNKINSILNSEKSFPQIEDFKKMVNQSLETLKIIGKIFSVKTYKKNFINNSLSRLKKNISEKKCNNNSLENFDNKLIVHFWNIHEVYINVIFKVQKKIDDFYFKISSSCQNISIFNGNLIFEECKNKQKFQYLSDLFFKFSNLSIGEKYHDQVLGAILNAVGLGKANKYCFLKNLKYVKS